MTLTEFLRTRLLRAVGDGRRPHQFPHSALGEEVIGWECQACGEWVREFGAYEPTECSVNWRAKARP